jgi:hypothetical protein
VFGVAANVVAVFRVLAALTNELYDEERDALRKRMGI